MMKLPSNDCQNRRRLLPRASRLWLFAIAALALALGPSEVEAGVITVSASAEVPDAIGSSADSIGQASKLRSLPFDQLAPGNQFWRLLACAGRDCSNGASAPSTTTTAGAPFGGGALSQPRADFQLRSLPSWSLAEEPDLPPSLMLISRPFHPPRNNG